MQENVFVCEKVSKRYGSFQALKQVSFSVGKGKIVGLLGPNGSGKSTLIKLANGLLVPTEGTIKIDGEPVGRRTKSMVSYLPERTYLNTWMRVEEMVEYFADFYEDFSKEKAYTMLSELHIDRKQRLSQLSKGNRERYSLF